MGMWPSGSSFSSFVSPLLMLRDGRNGLVLLVFMDMVDHLLTKDLLMSLCFLSSFVNSIVKV